MKPLPSYQTSRPEQLLETVVFNTARAKMMKALFTLESEPMRPQLLEWRSRTVDLIFDTLEPFRIAGAAARTRPEDVPSRRGLKQELWKIVKQAFSLAITMRCQRASYFTDFRPPMEDYVYDARTMRHVFGAPEGINSVLEACREVEGVSYHISSVGRVVLAVSPALVKVGEGTDWTVKRQLAKMNVIANIRMELPLPLCYTAAVLLTMYRTTGSHGKIVSRRECDGIDNGKSTSHW